MTRFISALILAFCWSVAANATGAPAAVASIKPVHSLLAAVMQGAGNPALLLDGHASPHTYALKPSDAAILEKAEIVFRIGPEMEAFLNGPLKSLSGSAKIIELADTPGLLRLDFRQAGVFIDGQRVDPAPASHHDDDHDDAHDAAHDDHDHEGSFDMHLWLDPVNAALMARRMADAMAELDPDNAALYQSNASALAKRLETLTSEIGEELEPVKSARFLVFHDAYHYFENRFGLHGAGSLALNPQNPPGAETVAELGEMAAGGSIACAFVEPQFSPRMVQAVADGAAIRIGTLDPLGASLKPGPDQYEELIRDMASAFADCLGGS